MRSTTGSQVPLSTFATYRPDTAPLSVNHQGAVSRRSPSPSTCAPGVALGDAVTAIDAAERDIGVPATVHGSFREPRRRFQASLASQPLLILAALAHGVHRARHAVREL